jgi:exopolysaccharide production protein ExoY
VDQRGKTEAMLRKHFHTLDRILRLLDLATIVLAFVLAMWSNPLLFASFRGSDLSVPTRFSAEHALFVISALIAWIALCRYFGFYRSHRSEPLSFTLRLCVKTEVLWMFVAGFSLFALKHYEVFDRGLIALFFGYSIVFVTCRSLLTIAFLHGLRRRGYNVRRVAIVGDELQAQDFAAFIAQKREMGYEVAQIRESKADETPPASNAELEEVFFILAPEVTSWVLKMLKRGKRVHILPGMFDMQLFRQEINDFAGVSVLSIGGNGLNELQAAFKRLVDMSVATLLLTLLSPFFSAVALAIKLTSSGPIFFAQERLGKNARRFRLYKFRTMVVNAEKVLREDPDLYARYVANNFKIPRGKDPRITRLGQLLRSTSLDELPQLLNVLRGDMSLVGPRPIVPAELAKYGDFAELFLSVKPGITGNWQINGRSEISDYLHRATMDLEYIRDQSLTNDVAIMLKTIPAVLRRRGAY